MRWLLYPLAQLRRRRMAYRLCCMLCWMIGWGATAYLMLEPGLTPPGGMNDKVAHALLYAVITMAAATFVDRLTRFLPLALLTWAVSAMLETFQLWVPGRTAGLADLAANSLGVTIGTAIGLAWISLCRHADRSLVPQPG